MELLAGDRLGKYEVIGRLAAGGMAEVYLAKILGHGGFAKAVALKRMLPALAEEPGFREMFMQEASLAARLNHPHVVQIFDFAEERGELYLAMEYVHGVNLRQLHADSLKKCRKDPALRIPPMLAASIVRDIARALAYAWTLPDERGAPLHLIHRDVSPHNVLLSWQGDVKLADFGIAKPAGALTSVGTLKGKLLYMAPEQLLGKPLDARSDLFALGLVLYETAMGAKPVFDGADQEVVKKAIQQRLIPPPARMDPDFPPMLSDVVMKALERDPARRFQSGAEFADALGECLHREAKSPLEYDLAAFMTRLYGEPQPLRGLNTPEPSSPGEAASSAPTPPASAAPDPEKVANDGRAVTLMREQALREREAAAAPAAPPSRPTIRMEPPSAEDEEFQARKQRTTVRDRGLPRKEDVQAAIQKVLAEQREAEAKASAEKKPVAAPVLGDSSVEPTAKAASPAAKWFAVAGACAVAAMGATWAALSRQHASELSAVQVQPSPPPEAVPAPSPAAEASPEPAPGSEPDLAPALAHAPAVAPGKTAAEEPGSEAAPPKAADGSESREEPKPAPKAAEPAAGAKAAPARPAVAGSRKGTGTLVVHIRPWVHVWVDGELFTGGVEQEAAPRLMRTLPAGRHAVHLRDGEGREKRVDAVVAADKQLTIEGTFDEFAVR